MKVTGTGRVMLSGLYSNFMLPSREMDAHEQPGWPGARDAGRYLHVREAAQGFGKSLIDQPVIRNRLATAAAALESMQTYIKSITRDMGSVGCHNERMGGQMAMMKYQSTRTMWKVSNHGVQVFGGRDITRTGMGAKTELQEPHEARA